MQAQQHLQAQQFQLQHLQHAHTHVCVCVCVRTHKHVQRTVTMHTVQWVRCPRTHTQVESRHIVAKAVMMISPFIVLTETKFSFIVLAETKFSLCPQGVKDMSQECERLVNDARVRQSAAYSRQVKFGPALGQVVIGYFCTRENFGINTSLYQHL